MTDERKTVRVQVLMTPSGVKAIDDWASEHGMRGRAEAVRRLAALGLKAAEDGTTAKAGGG
jgi:hypothetical protein